MPVLFEGCSTRTDKRLMTCCLNAPGNGVSCGACPRCSFREQRGSTLYECKNATCMDTNYCWAHFRKLYGVKIIVTQFGKGLAATRDIPMGHIVAPMGGVSVRKNQNWEGKKATPIYSYPLNVPDQKSLTFHRRPDRNNDGVRNSVRNSDTVDGNSVGRGFIADLEPVEHLASGAAGPIVYPQRWPQVQPGLADQRLRVAVEVKVDIKRKRKFWRQYLVRDTEFDLFQEEQIQRLARRLGEQVTPEFRKEHLTDTTLSFSDRNESLWNYNQFEAYIEFSQHKEVQLDATCLRRVGSYANDPSNIVAAERGGGLKVADPRRAEAEANAKIAANELFPLSPGHSGWLVATRDIKAGQQIQVFYGTGYWRAANAVKYDTKRVTVSPKRRPGQGRTLPVHVPATQRGLQRRPNNEPCKLKN